MIKNVINKPNHYTFGKYECIDIIKELTENKKGYEGYLLGNILKYLWRYEHKNGLEDLKKASNYLMRLIEYKSRR